MGENIEGFTKQEGIWMCVKMFLLIRGINYIGYFYYPQLEVFQSDIDKTTTTSCDYRLTWQACFILTFNYAQQFW